jgi:uncharacterized RDD family membrane protein YckC
MANGLQLEVRHDSQLDTRVEIVTPENIAFQYRVAGPFRRLPAYLLDFLFRLIVMLAVIFGALMTLGSVGARGMAMAVIAVTWFLMSWFYGGLFETFWNGQTPGKYLTRLRVLTVDGEPVTGWQAVLRNILRAADALPVVALPGFDSGPAFLPLYMAGLFACLASRRYQRLGDLVAGTMVVVEQRDLLSGVVPVADREVIELASQLPPTCRVSRSLARTLAAYVGRRRFFSAARREEMARSLGVILAQRYSMPSLESYDRLLCALYYRAFIADRPDAPSELSAAVAQPRTPTAVAIPPVNAPPAAGPDLDRWLDELH